MYGTEAALVGADGVLDVGNPDSYWENGLRPVKLIPMDLLLNRPRKSANISIVRVNTAINLIISLTAASGGRYCQKILIFLIACVMNIICSLCHCPGIISKILTGFGRLPFVRLNQ
jgi:hypothetical protein